VAPAEHEGAISVTRAVYRVEALWAELGDILRDLCPTARRPSGQSSMVLYAGRSAFRRDVHEPKSPVLSIVRLGASPLLLLDHRSTTHRILQAVSRPPSRMRLRDPSCCRKTRALRWLRAWRGL
jgi:hypothetical protein